jgi:alpha-tubulin suppressor-like RCC1 family protein
MKRVFGSIALVCALAMLGGACSRVGGGGTYSFESMQLASTQVGNPKPPPKITSAAVQTLNAVCSVLNRCDGISQDTCTQSVSAVGGMDASLGTARSYGPFVSLIRAEGAVSILANETAGNSCAAAISSLSCDDPLVQGAYKVGAVAPYAGTSAMVSGASTDCGKVFQSSLSITPPAVTLNNARTQVFTVSGGMAPYSYKLYLGSAGGILTYGGATANYQAPLAGSGTATIYVTDAQGNSIEAVVTISNKTPSEVHAGADYTCANVSGVLECFGGNSAGQLGNGVAGQSAVPTQTNPVLNAGPTSFSAVGQTTCAVQDGGLQCWGANNTGQIGNGTQVGGSTLVTVFPASSGVTSIANGSQSSATLAIQNGAVFSWGNGTYGQLGNGTAPAVQLTPVPVSPPLNSGVAKISSGSNNSCAIQGGTLYCWGTAAFVGNGNAPGNQTTPVAVAGLPASPIQVVDVSVGNMTTCAVTSDGALYCWGFNTYGTVGDGTLGTPRYTPIQIFASGVTAVSVGYYATCAIVNGGVQCWGLITYGQLGMDPATPSVSTSPHPVPNLTGTATAISVGDKHACAIVDGVLRCWGTNSSGQLGNGTTVDNYAPVFPGPWL